MNDSVSLRKIWIDSLKKFDKFSFPMKLYFTARKMKITFHKRFSKSYNEPVQ